MMNFISAMKEEFSSAGDYERGRSWENSCCVDTWLMKKREIKR